MPYLRPRAKKLRLGNPTWRWKMSYASLGLAGALCLIVASFSLLVATVPHGCFWPSANQSEGREGECFSLDQATAGWWPEHVDSGTRSREFFVPTKWLFEGAVDQTSGAPESLFFRNLVVTDMDLVGRTQFEEGVHSLQLRGRDLRFAVLDRFDLRRADLFGSDLRGASAAGAWLNHADLEGAQVGEANLEYAQLQGAVLILLCHKFRGLGVALIVRAQHGHRAILRTTAAASLRRSVAIESGTCRSVRSGGAAGSIIFGKARRLEARGGTRS